MISLFKPQRQGGCFLSTIRQRTLRGLGMGPDAKASGYTVFLVGRRWQSKAKQLVVELLHGFGHFSSTFVDFAQKAFCGRTSTFKIGKLGSGAKDSALGLSIWSKKLARSYVARLGCLLLQTAPSPTEETYKHSIALRSQVSQSWKLAQAIQSTQRSEECRYVWGQGRLRAQIVE